MPETLARPFCFGRSVMAQVFDLGLPMMGETSDGRTLIMFTPHMGRDGRDECDIVINDFDGYAFDNIPISVAGYVGYAVDVYQGNQVLSFTIHVSDRLSPLSADAREAFSHIALSYANDEVCIAAVKLRDTRRWYLNMGHPDH